MTFKCLGSKFTTLLTSTLDVAPCNPRVSHTDGPAIGSNAGNGWDSNSYWRAQGAPRYSLGPFPPNSLPQCRQKRSQDGQTVRGKTTKRYQAPRCADPPALYRSAGGGVMWCQRNADVQTHQRARQTVDPAVHARGSDKTYIRLAPASLCWESCPERRVAKSIITQRFLHSCG